ncbi:hypothetical protein DFH27DRAFT_577603 [Peziza echinospora]|nr:hypothetical protein DFH27DRAFT_587175 [Peziza echinospora]KAI5783868.1 hypothetical protein DFH27DRAFT_577603 [Peziza echinospora]
MKARLRHALAPLPLRMPAAAVGRTSSMHPHHLRTISTTPPCFAPKNDNSNQSDAPRPAPTPASPAANDSMNTILNLLKNGGDNLSSPSGASSSGKPAPKQLSGKHLTELFSISSDSLSKQRSPRDGIFGSGSPELRSFASILSNSAAPPQILEDERLPRMGPTAGRSVMVQSDVVSALTRLRSIVQANRVRQDMNKQRFHERPGLKKKRLRRERHKRRFKEGFKRMVGVVLDMKNRGM